MRWFSLVLLVGLTAGCTAANPKFGKGDGGTTQGPGPDSGTSITDFATSTGDGATGPGCAADARSCGATGSESCPDGTFVPDRTCPQGSTCSGGYCAEPTGTRSCSMAGFTSDALCEVTTMGGMQQNALACQPFVQNGALVWVCDTPFGTGTDETACTVGSACRSGVCGSNGFCFRPCAMDNDCGKQGNARTCTALTITVEGVTTSARGCVTGT
jgi:hypothetical protein